MAGSADTKLPHSAVRAVGPMVLGSKPAERNPGRRQSVSQVYHRVPADPDLPHHSLVSDRGKVPYPAAENASGDASDARAALASFPLDSHDKRVTRAPPTTGVLPQRAALDEIQDVTIGRVLRALGELGVFGCRELSLEAVE